MATTTNFGWETPDDTDLVKDGALAIRTLGSAIDTSLVDLKGGTTGQVLSKTSNTDMDFTWVTSDDADAIQNAIVDAKGDLITATAADTPARLAVGTNGQVLTVDSTTATGLKWASPAGGGKVLQVIYGDTTTSTTIASTTYTDTTLSASITPSATSSKILVFVSQNFQTQRNGDSHGGIKLLRGSTVVADMGGTNAFTSVLSIAPTVTSTADAKLQSFAYLDSPSTTSSTTYKTQAASYLTSNSGQVVCQQNSTRSTIILMEIGA